MIYKISEDSVGRVTVSEIDVVTRRVRRSARINVDAAERLLVYLAKLLPVESRVRRSRITLREMLTSSTTTLFDKPEEVRREDPGTTGHPRTYSPLARRGTVSV